MTDLSALPFGVSEFTTKPWTFEQDIATYPRLGVASIEICEIKLDATRYAAQLDLIQPSGLTVSSVQPAIRTLFPSLSQPEPRDPPERMARFRRTIERIAPTAVGAPFVTNTGIPPGGNMQYVRDVAAREYRDLAAFAQDHGVRIALEPLNAAIMNVESAIWTLDQAMEIVAAVDHPSFGVCLDFWNVWQNAGIAESIRLCGDRIFVTQVSDWHTPRSFEDRFIVGQGEIPLPTLLRATHDSGYCGPYVVEIFSGDVPDSLWQRDLAEVITTSKAGLDRAWQEALVSTDG